MVGKVRGIVSARPRGKAGVRVPGVAKTKVGHLGTLDPIATGVLPLVIGRATRLAQFYTRSEKIYEGVVRFGWATTTYDRAGEPVGERAKSSLMLRNWSAISKNFAAGFCKRRPPVSAKKVDGRRAYELARNNCARSNWRRWRSRSTS